MTRWLLVRNAEAGTDDAETVDTLRGLLEPHGGAEVRETSDADELADVLREAASSDAVVVVCGGDGSISLAVAQGRRLGLLDQLTFGLVPFGTGNDLAGFLELPGEADAAAEQLLAATPRPMDLLLDDEGDVVVNAVHVGVGVAAAERADDLKPSLGALAYPLGALLAGVGDDGLEVSVEVDGERVEAPERVLMVAVMNGSTVGGGTAIAPEAVIDDGLADVVVVHAVARPARAAYAAALLRGTHLERDDVVHARGAEVVIRGTDLAHNRDGEVEEAAAGATQRRYVVEAGAWSLLR